MTFAEKAVPRWVDEVKRTYGHSSTKYACVGYVYFALVRLLGMSNRRLHQGTALEHRMSAMNYLRTLSLLVHSLIRPS